MAHTPQTVRSPGPSPRPRPEGQAGSGPGRVWAPGGLQAGAGPHARRVFSPSLPGPRERGAAGKRPTALEAAPSRLTLGPRLQTESEGPPALTPNHGLGGGSLAGSPKSNSLKQRPCRFFFFFACLGICGVFVFSSFFYQQFIMDWIHTLIMFIHNTCNLLRF